MKDYIKTELNRVAETQFFLRPVLEKALQNNIVTEEGKKYCANCDNYHQFWQLTHGHSFFDMGTFIRLGSAIEKCFKYYYMGNKGYKTNTELLADPNYAQNIFQRIQSWQNNGVRNLFISQLSYDIRQIPELSTIQEAMMHRHLYAHNSGLIDDTYLDRIQQITGIDLRNEDEIKNQYPSNDVYWFKPLKELSKYIEGARKFFSQLP